MIPSRRNADACITSYYLYSSRMYVMCDVCVEVSSFDLDTHSTATRIVVVTAEDKIDLGCHRYSCYKRYE